MGEDTMLSTSTLHSASSSALVVPISEPTPVRVFLERTPTRPPGSTDPAKVFAVDDADAARCVVLAVGGAHFRLRRDRLCAHSERIRQVLSAPPARPRSDTQGSQHTASDSGYESGADSALATKEAGSREEHEDADVDVDEAKNVGGKVVGGTVVVEGVDAADFGEMLRAMDDAISYVVRPPRPHTLACVLRAAHTLSCTDLVQFSSTLLRDVWSPDLRRVASDALPAPDALEAVLLARALGVPGVLKRAFYELLRARVDEHAHLHDNECDQENANEHEHEHEHSPYDALPLAPADQRRLHTAHGELQMAWAGLVWTMPNSRALQCRAAPPHRAPLAGGSDLNVHENAYHDQCAARPGHDRFQTWRELLEELDLFAPHDPLDALRRLADLDWAARGFCAECAAARREVFMKKREELWNKLDGWLDL